MTAALQVLAPGLSTTFQDMGRLGYQDVGVPVSGALDTAGARLANALAGNAPQTPVLEMLLQGAALQVQAESARLALFCDQGELCIQGAYARRVPAGRSVRVVRGEVVRVGTLGQSLCGYLAVEGGFDVPLALGSASTYVRGAIGGLDGRALRRGDRLALRVSHVAAQAERALAVPFDAGAHQAIRVLLGPQDDYFTPAAIQAFLAGPYTVSPQADRMGLRLDGPMVQHAHGHDLVSDGIVSGAIQVTGSGQPIVLLADAQTTGGYPKIATVISADLPVLARRRPGAAVRFEPVTLAQAEACARAAHARLASICASGLREMPPEGTIDPLALRTGDLSSGLV